MKRPIHTDAIKKIKKELNGENLITYKKKKNLKTFMETKINF